MSQTRRGNNRGCSCLPALSNLFKPLVCWNQRSRSQEPRHEAQRLGQMNQNQLNISINQILADGVASPRNGGFQTQNMPPIVPGTNQVIPQELDMEEVRERNKVRIKTSVNKNDVKCINTYDPDQADVYKHCCPVCLSYYNTILVSSCCKNYICRLCIGTMAKKAKKDPKFVIRCTHCMTNDFKLNDFQEGVDPVRYYSDTPAKWQQLKNKQQQETPKPKDSIDVHAEVCQDNQQREVETPGGGQDFNIVYQTPQANAIGYQNSFLSQSHGSRNARPAPSEFYSAEAQLRNNQSSESQQPNQEMPDLPLIVITQNDGVQSGDDNTERSNEQRQVNNDVIRSASQRLRESGIRNNNLLRPSSSSSNTQVGQVTSRLNYSIPNTIINSDAVGQSHDDEVQSQNQERQSVTDRQISRNSQMVRESHEVAQSENGSLNSFPQPQLLESNNPSGSQISLDNTPNSRRQLPVLSRQSIIYVASSSNNSPRISVEQIDNNETLPEPESQPNLLRPRMPQHSGFDPTAPSNVVVKLFKNSGRVNFQNLNDSHQMLQQQAQSKLKVRNPQTNNATGKKVVSLMKEGRNQVPNFQQHPNENVSDSFMGTSSEVEAASLVRIKSNFRQQSHQRNVDYEEQEEVVGEYRNRFRSSILCVSGRTVEQVMVGGEQILENDSQSSDQNPQQQHNSDQYRLPIRRRSRSGIRLQPIGSLSQSQPIGI